MLDDEAEQERDLVSCCTCVSAARQGQSQIEGDQLEMSQPHNTSNMELRSLGLVERNLLCCVSIQWTVNVATMCCVSLVIDEVVCCLFCTELGLRRDDFLMCCEMR